MGTEKNRTFEKLGGARKNWKNIFDKKLDIWEIQPNLQNNDSDDNKDDDTINEDNHNDNDNNVMNTEMIQNLMKTI